ncbi:hypothetical protein [Blautia hydrogenotrophica]|uniref:hypothetical protein n=1 Tax=Blautia hydrogenotrophica TaxID=53443 RepID=UPI000B08098C|nr:hypothetical protein [Blautia hydrogenotrophica]
MDFNALGDTYIIIIAPFDLFGEGRYQYTFEMRCKENPEISLEDGAVRIFLNTRSQNPQDVSPELMELLSFIEHTNQTPADGTAQRSGNFSGRYHRSSPVKKSG